MNEKPVKKRFYMINENRYYNQSEVNRLCTLNFSDLKSAN